MPYTLNGIGTHYYGRGNRSDVQGRCEHCGCEARLSSYDTWECFCIVFIPLIPLKHYRILNECSSCTRHNRLPLADFRAVFDEKVAPLRERVARSPQDAEARRALIDALMGLQMWTEADREAREGVAALPADPELNRLAGELARYRGDNAGATPYLRHAVELAPRNVQLRTFLGQHLFEQGQRDEAIRELSQAQALDSSYWQAGYWLGRALLAAERWSEALPALERVLGQRADFAQDPSFVADIARCKKALNYPLSPEELKAVRRRWWWPFGSAAPRGSRRANWLGALPLLGALAALVVAAVCGIAWWRQQHVRIVFDNGLRRPVTVTLGSESFPLTPRGLIQRSIAPGRHEVVVSSAAGLIEQTPIQIASLGLLDSLFDSRLYVYNVAARHIYRVATIIYAAHPSKGPGPRPRLIACQRFLMETGISYAFEPPPESISLSSSTSMETRTALSVERQVDHVTLALIRRQEGNLPEAQRAARMAVEIDGCALEARRTLVRLLGEAAQTEEALKEVEAWGAACPDARLEADRTQQDVMRAAGRTAELLAAYRERLTRTPGDAAAHYLLGRLLDDPEASLPEQREAVRLDPKLTFAHAAVASGRLADARLKLEGLSQSAPRDTTLLEARWLIAVAQRDWPAATQLDRQLVALNDDDRDSLERNVTTSALAGDAASVERAFAAATPSTEARQLVAGLRFARLVEARQPQEPVRVLDTAYAGAKAEVPHLQQLHAAAALLLAGRKPEADERLKRVLLNDPGTGIARHADAGYEAALSFAKKAGVRIPMAKAVTSDK